MAIDSQRAKSIFLAALEREGEEREALLAEACAGDADLRQRVDRLLHAHDRPDSVPELPAPMGPTLDRVTSEGELPAPETEAAAEEPGKIIGPYKLVQLLGEGGMGAIYMAQQTAPVRRLVALKLIKPGMDSRQVIARFEAERQALAVMEHPNIAKVFDAGTTEQGRPYFVMERVKGVPITRYCDEHRLTPRQRLELFIPVCQAIQHAHQKGIIHRDIKPSNVLVALYDGTPVPKVIDFGIAKATGPQLTDLTLVTGFGAVVGTLEYMSPEQAELNQLDIDTRSDVYSLGVLLYELLTGTTPLMRKRLRQAAMLEVLRLIREEEPPRPSTRLSTTDEMPSIAANRGMEPKKLSGTVRGELDWVVMKALEKNRNRRYETANGLARDIQRYLVDEPVQACPPSVAYRLRKFARRHKGALTVAALMLMLVLAGTAVSTWQAVRATIAERNTRTVLALVTTEQAKTREALDALTDDVVEGMFAKQVELDETEKAFLRKVLGLYGAITQQMGETTEARYLCAKGYYNVGHLHGLLGEQVEAVAAYRQAEILLGQLVVLVPDLPEYREKLARTHNNLGVLLTELRKETEAEASFHKALDFREKLAKDFPKVSSYSLEVALSYNDLAFLFEKQQKYKDAEKAFHQALEIEEKLVSEADALPVYHRVLARTRSNLGQLQREQGNYTDAEKVYQQALVVQKKQHADSPAAPRVRRELADSYHGLGIVLAELKKFKDAETAFLQAVALRKKLTDDFPQVAQFRRELANGYNDLGNLLQRQGNEKAETAFRNALPLWEQLAKDSPNVSDYRSELAGTLGKLAHRHNQRGEFAAAVKLLEQARPHQEAALKASPQNPKYLLFCRNNLMTLARSQVKLGDHARLALTAGDLVRFGNDPPNDAYLAACILCNCATLVDKDANLGEARRLTLARSYADQAVMQLQKAVASGFKDVAHLNNNPDLKPLQAREEFQKLLADLDGNIY